MRVEPVSRIKMEGEFKWRGGKLWGGAQMISSIDQRIENKIKVKAGELCWGLMELSNWTCRYRGSFTALRRSALV